MPTTKIRYESKAHLVEQFLLLLNHINSKPILPHELTILKAFLELDDT